jgi:hypothetical protein
MLSGRGSRNSRVRAVEPKRVDELARIALDPARVIGLRGGLEHLVDEDADLGVAPDQVRGERIGLIVAVEVMSSRGRRRSRRARASARTTSWSRARLDTVTT